MAAAESARRRQPAASPTVVYPDSTKWNSEIINFTLCTTLILGTQLWIYVTPAEINFDFSRNEIDILNWNFARFSAGRKEHGSQQRRGLQLRSNVRLQAQKYSFELHFLHCEEIKKLYKEKAKVTDNDIASNETRASV